MTLPEFLAWIFAVTTVIAFGCLLGEDRQRRKTEDQRDALQAQVDLLCDEYPEARFLLLKHTQTADLRREFKAIVKATNWKAER